MGVDVDEAGEHERTVGVELLPTPTLDPPDLGDHAAGHGHVGGPPRRVFLCHGEPEALTSFAKAVRDDLHLDPVIPALGQSFAL